jgi:hypothetical protein
MAAIPVLILGFAAMTTTNHTAYACFDNGCGVGFHHWAFYHWGIGFYHWHWHTWGTPCCNTYEGSCCNSDQGPAPVVACSGCGDDQTVPTPTNQWNIYQVQHTQQTVNNYVTVNVITASIVRSCLTSLSSLSDVSLTITDNKRVSLLCSPRR